MLFFCVFKQKTAYEMRISDWSSDVCSSDLAPHSTITVTAPISGTITELAVRPGMTVAAGQTLAQISDFAPIWLEAAVPERLAGNVRVGQSKIGRAACRERVCQYV